MLIIGLTTMILTSCQKQDEVMETSVVSPEPEKNYVLADLALSLPSSSAGTRQSEDVVQTNGKDFRGISKLSIIPFDKRGIIGLYDKPAYYENSNSYEDLMANTPTATEHWLYYEKLYLMRGVASFLTYGQASHVPSLPSPLPAALPSFLSSEIRSKAFYGSMMTNIEGEKTVGIPDRVVDSPVSLNFELEPIFDVTTVPSEAQLIANYLTWVANAKFGENTWRNTDDPWLSNFYKSFVNRNLSVTDSEEYDVIAGSADNVKAFIKVIIAKLGEHLNNYESGTIPYNIAKDIQYRLTSFTGELGGKRLAVLSDGNGGIALDGCATYPRNLGLPDGAAVLLWSKKENSNEYAFIPQMETSPFANICSVSRYVYPAELYYRGNSTIVTSNEEVSKTVYTGTWDQVLAHNYTSGNVVTSSTKAVAMEKTMQYAVAHLAAKVKASATLKDRTGSEVIFNDNTFPITGIIISGQNPVGFDFVPETADKGEDRECFIYDRYLNDGQSLYLTTSEPAKYSINTLLLQTKESEDITVILELRNDGDQFEGESGTVYPGTQFYLVGKIRLSGKDTSNVDPAEVADVKKRVFTQDHTTTLNMKVETLAHAFNVMPNVQSDRLQVSVEISLDWIQAEPTNINFEEDDQ